VYGVRVSALCPGWVDTPMLDLPDGRGGTTRETLRQFRAGSPVSTAAVATAALRGLRRNTPVIVTPPAAARVWRLTRLAPATSARVAARLAARLAAR
jgi:short-subunit dehydrogenase